MFVTNTSFPKETCANLRIYFGAVISIFLLSVASLAQGRNVLIFKDVHFDCNNAKPTFISSIPFWLYQTCLSASDIIFKTHQVVLSCYI